MNNNSKNKYKNSDFWRTLLRQLQQSYYFHPQLYEDRKLFLQQLKISFRNRHGNFDDWWRQIANINDNNNYRCQLNNNTITFNGDSANNNYDAICKAAQMLIPWRKGAFQINELFIDSEWQCHLKYARLRQLPNLAAAIDNARILDVGCGNGYFMLRLLGDGAAAVLGFDPSWHALAQFLFLQKIAPQHGAALYPLTLQQFQPRNFDITLSMGVLYHRRAPLEHLQDLKNTLAKNGLLVIETLVIEGDEQTVFIPKKNYAGMSNVWFIPSILALTRWLERLDLQVVFSSASVATTNCEQRRTNWTRQRSLADFMNDDFSATIEGYPPPSRAMIVARRK